MDDVDKYRTVLGGEGQYTATKHMINTRAGLQQALINKEHLIYTTQMSACRTKHLVDGYRLFVYLLDYSVVEISLGTSTCGKDIREAHNIEKMLLAGTFGQANIDEEGARLTKIFDEIVADQNKR